MNEELASSVEVGRVKGVTLFEERRGEDRIGGGLVDVDDDDYDC